MALSPEHCVTLASAAPARFCPVLVLLRCCSYRCCCAASVSAVAVAIATAVTVVVAVVAGVVAQR